MRSTIDTENTVAEYADMVRRICFCHMKNEADAQDVFQDVFLKYMLFDGIFESEEHKKAWIIRVTVNACKDSLKSWFRTKRVDTELIEEIPELQKENSKILTAVLQLPVKYRDVLYLHYYEQYSAIEVASLLGMKENTVYSILSRGRTMLKDKLGGAYE